MKQLKSCLYLIVILSQLMIAQSIAQWRGPDRNGIFPESNLLKSWPETGPDLLWLVDGLDKGFSCPSVTDEIVYITGLEDSTEYLTALDMKGNRLWRLAYGLGGRQTFPDTRCTPTVEDDRVYLISGRGEVVCVDTDQQKIQWHVPAFEKFQGKHWIWEIAESPLLVDDLVIYTPGGHQTTMVAMDKFNGKTVWKTETLHDTTAFVSPILIKFGGKKIIVNILIHHVFGVDAQNGQILWKVKYSDIHPPTFHPYAPKNNCITPIYHDGYLYITSGYDHVGVMFKLMNKGNDITKVWVDSTLDCHHGQVVHVGKYIYGSNWIDNRNGNWCCIDWNTGETVYEKEWQSKGSISAADGMLYCYEEKRGNVALVEPTPQDFKIISSFRITEGSGPHWSQPVIHDGTLYIRHGNALMAYDIKASH
ncbi:PQQ-binding-like beta-propeller repeat protein [bacterium]